MILYSNLNIIKPKTNYILHKNELILLESMIKQYYENLRTKRSKYIQHDVFDDLHPNDITDIVENIAYRDFVTNKPLSPIPNETQNIEEDMDDNENENKQENHNSQDRQNRQNRQNNNNKKINESKTNFSKKQLSTIYENGEENTNSQRSNNNEIVPVSNGENQPNLSLQDFSHMIDNQSQNAVVMNNVTNEIEVMAEEPVSNKIIANNMQQKNVVDTQENQEDQEVQEVEGNDIIHNSPPPMLSKPNDIPPPVPVVRKEFNKADKLKEITLKMARKKIKDENCINVKYLTDYWKDHFPKNTSMFRFDHNVTECHFLLVKFVMKDFDFDRFRNVTNADIKQTLIEEYTRLFNHSDRKVLDGVSDRWKKEEKEDLLRIQNASSIESIIMNETYKLTEMDVCILFNYHKIPTIILHQSRGKEKINMVAFADSLTHGFYYFIRITNQKLMYLASFKQHIRFHTIDLSLELRDHIQSKPYLSMEEYRKKSKSMCVCVKNRLKQDRNNLFIILN